MRAARQWTRPRPRRGSCTSHGTLSSGIFTLAVRARTRPEIHEESPCSELAEEFIHSLGGVDLGQSTRRCPRAHLGEVAQATSASGSQAQSRTLRQHPPGGRRVVRIMRCRARRPTRRSRCRQGDHGDAGGDTGRWRAFRLAATPDPARDLAEQRIDRPTVAKETARPTMRHVTWPCLRRR